MATQHFALETPFIRLDDLLKCTGLVQTGGQAKLCIQSGGVLLNGEICTIRGKKLRGGEVIRILETDEEVFVDCP